MASLTEHNGQTQVTTEQTVDNHEATFRHQDPWKLNTNKGGHQEGEDQTPSRTHRREETERRETNKETTEKASQERNNPQHKGHLVQSASHPELEPRHIQRAT